MRELSTALVLPPGQFSSLSPLKPLSGFSTSAVPLFSDQRCLAAVNRRLDIFGIPVLSFVAGNFGGITRDVLIGAVPPAALSDERYLLVSVLAGLITFSSYVGVDKLKTPCVPVRRGGTGLLRGRRRAKSDHVRTKPDHVRSSRHVDRHRRRDDARRAPEPDPAGAAFGFICRCSAGWRRHRRRRPYVRTFLWRFGPRGRGFVLRPSLHGDQVWMAIARWSSFRQRPRRSEFSGL